MSYYNLFNLSIKERSLVKNPAVKNAKILISKSKDNDNHISIQKTVKIEKSNEIEKKIYGYVLEPDEIDEQGHKITKEEIKKAVDQYNRNLAIGFKKGTGTGYEHILFDDSIAYPIINVFDESGDIAKAIGIPEDKIIKGGWLTGDQLTEKGYDLYKKGEFTGWSIGGVGEQEYIKDDVIEKSITSQSLPKWLPNFFNKMKILLDDEVPNLDEWIKEWIIKNTVSTIISETEYQIYSGIQNDNDESISDFQWNDKQKENIIELNKKNIPKKENIFKRMFGFINKSEKTNKMEEKSLEKEDIIKMIDDKIEPLINTMNEMFESVKSFSNQSKKDNSKIDKNDESDKKDVDIEKSKQNNDEVISLINKQNEVIESLSKKIDDIQKSKPNSTQLDNDETTANILSGSLYD